MEMDVPANRRIPKIVKSNPFGASDFPCLLHVKARKIRWFADVAASCWNLHFFRDCSFRAQARIAKTETNPNLYVNPKPLPRFCLPRSSRGRKLANIGWRLANP